LRDDLYLLPSTEIRKSLAKRMVCKYAIIEEENEYGNCKQEEIKAD
jgi:hypothetical protein